MDEDPPLKKCSEVPDIIISKFPNTKLWLQRLYEEDDSSSLVHLSDGYAVVLRHDPFVCDEASDNRVASLNSHGLFDFE
ncbi:Glycoside hydrolase [Sesbania bispinosa]|nr:Glycoside hydrolase [Sesbania bispinosa]